MNHKEILEDFFETHDVTEDALMGRCERDLFFKFADGKMTRKECDDALIEYYSNKYDNMLECNQWTLKKASRCILD